MNKGEVILAPMAGVTDKVYRRVCRYLGADECCTPMVSVKSLLYGNKNAFELIETDPNEPNAVVQIFGNDPEDYDRICSEWDFSRYSRVDINMGCPAPKIVKQGSGSALMGNIGLAESVIKAAVRGLEKQNCTLPLSVKFRLGIDDTCRNWIDFGKMAEAAGATIISLHPRTAKEMYLGHSHWECIAELVDNVSIPVVGNGDIKCYADSEKMMNDTGCTGVMVGRGCFGNPWIFKSIKEKYDYIPSETEKLGMGIIHAKMLTEELPERLAILQMRKHIAWYIKGMPEASDIRQKINLAVSLEQLTDILISYSDALEATAPEKVLEYIENTEADIRSCI